MWDWMHIFVAGGIFQVELGLLLEQLRGCGVSQAIASRGATGRNVFEKKLQGSDPIKCSASEALSLYFIEVHLHRASTCGPCRWDQRLHQLLFENGPSF